MFHLENYGVLFFGKGLLYQFWTQLVAPSAIQEPKTMRTSSERVAELVQKT